MQGSQVKYVSLVRKYTAERGLLYRAPVTGRIGLVAVAGQCSPERRWRVVRQKLKLPVWLIPLAWAAALVGGVGINLLLGGRVALPGVTGARLLTAAASTALMAATVATASGALSHIRPFQTAFASGAGAVTFSGLLLYPDLSASGLAGLRVTKIGEMTRQD